MQVSKAARPVKVTQGRGGVVSHGEEILCSGTVLYGYALPIKKQQFILHVKEWQ